MLLLLSIQLTTSTFLLAALILINIFPISAERNQLELLTYPNPVASELRITIPGSWQSKAVTYQLFDVNGRLVKQIADKNASQTQTLSLQSIHTGSYFLVAFTKEEKLTQRIIKN